MSAHSLPLEAGDIKQANANQGNTNNETTRRGGIRAF